jgi:hypothetical protein
MPTDDHLHNLAAEFFHAFSRAEYALKAAGYNNGDGPAEANWSRFARSIEDRVAAPPIGDTSDAISFLLSEPPKKQYLSNGLLEWWEVPANTGPKADDLFLYIRRIRNNLFHGGKFNVHWFAPERNEQLMKAGLCVLRWAMHQDARVFEAHQG